MKLYTYFRSSAAFRVRIALHVKRLPFESKFINLKPGNDEQFAKEYTAINPQARVPFLVDGTVELSQSTAIIEYLEDAYSDVPLLPTGIHSKAIVRQLVNLVACDIHPLNNLAVLQKLKKDFSASQEQCDEWYRDWIITGFSALESLLEKHSGTYCVGDQITMADVYLVPQVWNAHRFSVSLDPFPTINKIYNNCLLLEAFVNSLPENQEDSPK
jgi:maleylacetoacetate isomerase